MLHGTETLDRRSSALLLVAAVRPTGKVNLVGLLLLGAVGAAVYWAVMFVPKYVDNLEVKEAVEASLSSAGRAPDSSVKDAILRRANAPSMGSTTRVDESGQPVELPGLGLTEDNIVIDADPNAKKVTVTVEYDRVVVLKPTDNVKVLHFRVENSGPLQ